MFHLRLLALALASSSLAAEFEFAPHKFTVPDGFIVERVAGPPLVDRPITMALGEDGALYVADSSGSNEKPAAQVKNPTHRVVRLVDRDGDGVFDAATVFADKLSFPEGTMWLDGSLYVAAPPVIWKLTDTNGDGVADRREVWFDGKTLNGCANDLHGPYAGPDGFIYWCKGAFEEQHHKLADGREFVTRASHVFRARPDGSGLDVVFTAGMDNPVDVAFSESGEMFVSGTFFQNPANGKRDGIAHAVHGGVWGKEHAVLDGHFRTGPLLPVMTQLGPAAACGLEMPRSDALGLRGELLCCQFNMRKVSRHSLAADGATFKTTDSDLLVSDQMDFHPTDIIEAADGSLLIADTGGWYKLCCPTSTLAKPDVLGAIYRLRRKDAPLVRDGDAHKRLDAIRALTRTPGDAARAGVRAAVAEEGAVAVAAMHSVALWRDAGAFDALVARLGSGDAHIRRVAAEALGRLRDARALPHLRAASLAPADRFLQHALAYAIHEITDDGSTPARPVAALALGEPVPAPAQDPALLAKQRARIEELAALSQHADAARGAEVYRSAKALCTTCHAMAGVGGTLGPDLTKVGAIRTERDLIEAIVFPSASLVRSYEPLLVTTKAGEQLGLLKAEAADAIVLATGAGVEVRIARADVLSARAASMSLMPPAFDGLLTPQELADLVAYLRTAK